MRWKGSRQAVFNLAVTMVFLAVAAAGPASSAMAQSWDSNFCQSHEYLCTGNEFNYLNGKHIGHDEPALLFYSSTPGAGNSSIYNLTLPKDPPRLPKQDASGGTFNFQLHPAFWFGMAMCDTQSFPEFTNTCAPDTDANIFDNSDSNAPDYIGKHPGTAFMEMQFYPPGWVPWGAGGLSCDGKHWCAAINIDSFDFSPSTGLNNNSSCLASVGREPVNFAFITKSGVADSSGDPLNAAHFFPNLTNDLLMNPGDNLTLDMHDTADGFEVVIYDNTTHQRGSMKAGTANGFAQVNYAPVAASCTSTPYAFHPMYATSGLHTRVPWAAHSYNIAFSDEIGHWDYCSSTDSQGNCTEPGRSGEPDETACFDSTASSRVKVGGCLASDDDFDGVSYINSWAGTGTNAATDAKLHPRAITFSSPLFDPTTPGPLANFDMQAFEADLPAIEPTATCDTSTGAGCTNPPAGAAFYPFFSIGTERRGGCTWRLGGQSVAGSTDTFGGVSQYGSLLALIYPSMGSTITRFNDFRSTPASNPCDAVPPSLTLPARPIAFGKVVVGKNSAVRSLRISNPTSFPVTLGLSLPSDYHIDAGKLTTCPNPGILAPGGKCAYGLTLTPSIIGADNGLAAILTNADNATLTVSLVGTGK